MYKPIFFIQTIELSPDEILEGNKIIAKGIGMKFNDGTIYPFTKTSVWYNMYYQEPKFFIDYNWIMNAVELIELMNENISIIIEYKTTTITNTTWNDDLNAGDTIIECTANSKIESIWLAIREYYKSIHNNNIK
jgi:hypothetical protein